MEGAAVTALTDNLSDEPAIWLYREKLARAGAVDALCARSRSNGQRDTEEEKQAIKAGRIPEEWKAKPAKLRQKDCDARWRGKYSKAKERPDGSKPPDAKPGIRRRQALASS